MTAQIVFHGINRSAAVEAAVNEKLEGLAKFDNQIGPCKVTVTQEGHQTMRPFTIRVDLVASGRNLIVTRTNQDVMAALTESFDTIRRSVVEEADKRRQH